MPSTFSSFLPGQVVFLVVRDACQTEVENLHHAGAVDQNVARFDVAVNESDFVRVLKADRRARRCSGRRGPGRSGPNFFTSFFAGLCRPPTPLRGSEGCRPGRGRTRGRCSGGRRTQWREASRINRSRLALSSAFRKRQNLDRDAASASACVRRGTPYPCRRRRVVREPCICPG